MVAGAEPDKQDMAELLDQLGQANTEVERAWDEWERERRNSVIATLELDQLRAAAKAYLLAEYEYQEAHRLELPIPTRRERRARKREAAAALLALVNS